jgi:hypothetical protein
MKRRWNYTLGNVVFVWLGGVLLGVGIVLFWHSPRWEGLALIGFALCNTAMAAWPFWGSATDDKQNEGASAVPSGAAQKKEQHVSTAEQDAAADRPRDAR